MGRAGFRADLRRCTGQQNKKEVEASDPDEEVSSDKKKSHRCA